MSMNISWPAALAAALVPAIVHAADSTRATAPDVLTNSIGMKLFLIPPGEFEMGSPAGERGREEEELPHRVTISRAFRIGATEVTQAQWAKVMGSRRGSFEGDENPVETISWTDAVAFCRKLSQMEKRTYRLPTEAEWEYACRAGASNRFSGAEHLDDVAWFDGNSEGRPRPVAGKRPSAWGLYDMHGNVAEWCADVFGPYGPGASADPAGPAEGRYRVVRGGSWSSFERGCRSASRSSQPPNYQLKTIGFRVVLEE